MWVENALQAAKIRKPTEQLACMTERFAAKSASSSKFSKWFQPAARKTIPDTRIIKNSQIYENVPARTARYGQLLFPTSTTL